MSSKKLRIFTFFYVFSGIFYGLALLFYGLAVKYYCN
nr:MAG TPA: Protein of unknown function (DUF2854) [Caudoviricetes sp.]